MLVLYLKEIMTFFTQFFCNYFDHICSSPPTPPRPSQSPSHWIVVFVLFGFFFSSLPSLELVSKIWKCLFKPSQGLNTAESKSQDTFISAICHAFAFKETQTLRHL